MPPGQKLAQRQELSQGYDCHSKLSWGENALFKRYEGYHQLRYSAQAREETSTTAGWNRNSAQKPKWAIKIPKKQWEIHAGPLRYQRFIREPLEVVNILKPDFFSFNHKRIRNKESIADCLGGKYSAYHQGACPQNVRNLHPAHIENVRQVISRNF